jgi:large subunit ribosomal protein L13
MQKAAEVKHDWIIIDAKDRILGDVAVEIATKLTGKHKITFTPHIDDGDFVVVTNAALVKVTGGKETKKIYYRHALQPGSMRTLTFAEKLTKDPASVIQRAVYNMIPKNKLRSVRLARLKVYAGAEHPHTSVSTAVKEVE